MHHAPAAGFAVATIRLIRCLAACVLLWWLPASGVRASVANAPGANLEVYLVTYGPGDVYWERFGHDAIELRDAVGGEAINFNYGMFDFNAKNFFLNFARGRMRYLMDAEPTEPEEADYVAAGRSITRQRLALSPQQAGALRDFLLWNLRPENVGYPYDYYVDNCTTRVRDAFDKALGGIIHTQLLTQTGSMTYRQQTVRLMRAQPWLMLVLDLGLGPYADQPMNGWTESFLPEVLQHQLRSIRVPGAAGGNQPLVESETVLAPSRVVAPPASAPDLRLPLAAAGLALALILLATARWWRTGYALLVSMFCIAAGLVGVILIALWTLTAHHSAWANANLLLFSPLAFLLSRAAWRLRHGHAPSRLAGTALSMQLLAVLAAIALHALPGTVQQNQPWILFALPVWLAVAWTLRQERRAVT
ncbi:MAG: DUF4105 domain-containing protein [Rhodanobacter sp.]|nr:MAG: DUF4105 domain-containing protein [Rhodanobacter sp.]TAM09312.1 MAG: DUF4105 domain-containing protein [Rhodanobacter sp.]TAM37257.1 MAG: DUF4105 domain-containing protein [Rhodanobacter sp.]